MFPFKRIKLKSFERGALFKKGDFVTMLDGRDHWIFDPVRSHRVETFSVRGPWIYSADLDVLIKQEAFGQEAIVLDLSDNERALVWIDGRFDRVLAPGQYAIWNCYRDVRVETVRCDVAQFTHKDLETILATGSGKALLESFLVPDGHVGLVYQSGELKDELPPGRYAFWKERSQLRFFVVELREEALELTGQELMTADKVTLRINALVGYRVVDAKQAVRAVSDFKQALYRECQLGLRSLVGAATLDELLARKNELRTELQDLVGKKASGMGLSVTECGIKDIILPGEMKELLNKVTEAKKAAEASVITRREETAAIRSQLNTAKLMEDNPTLLRLRELETLERVVSGCNLSVVAGEQGITEKVLKLI